VHGCFWHNHRCSKATLPANNAAFWKAKFRDNRRRDRRKLAELASLGVTGFVVWECEIEDCSASQVLRGLVRELKKHCP
jgi:DNA mismatch endonuclease (patch repair protein)